MHFESIDFDWRPAHVCVPPSECSEWQFLPSFQGLHWHQ
jgi:hypothetical protein